MTQPRVIFVFGSNLAGAHLGGAALDAKRFWGAQEGTFAGATGESYAIPTVDFGGHALPVDIIRRYVGEFLGFARQQLEIELDIYGRGRFTTVFYVTPIGCGIAGFTVEDIAPLFRGAPSNVQLPHGWREVAA